MQTFRRSLTAGAAAIGAIVLALTGVVAGAVPAQALDVSPAEDTIHETAVPNAVPTEAFTGEAIGPDGAEWFVGSQGTIARQDSDEGVTSFAVDGPRAADGPTLVGLTRDLGTLWTADRGDDTVRRLTEFGESTAFPVGGTPADVEMNYYDGEWVPTEDGFIVHLHADGTATKISFPTARSGDSRGIQAVSDRQGGLEFIVPDEPALFSLTWDDHFTQTPLPGAGAPTSISSDGNGNGTVLVGLSGGDIATVDPSGTFTTVQNPAHGAVLHQIVPDAVNGGVTPWFRETIDGTTSAVGYLGGNGFHVVETQPIAVQDTTTLAMGGLGPEVGWVANSAGGRSGIEYFEFDGTRKFLPTPTRNGTSSAPISIDGFSSAQFGTADGHIGTAAEIKVNRLAGMNRWATGAAASAAAYPSGASTVFIASGTAFPDALTAAPAAAKMGAPVLLVTEDGIPSQVSDEIRRLGATHAVIVGGEAAVGPVVARQLSTLMGTSNVTRLGGADRIATSEIVAKWAFGSSGAEQAMIVTGWSAPDALAAGAAIGTAGPVLLVNGSTGVPRTDTASTLRSLGVQSVYVAGGAAVVPATLVDPLASIATVHRVAGSDRYATADALASTFHPSASTVVIATGTTFPDALAGSALAAHLGAPLVLSTPDCVPAATRETIALEGVRTATLLGGDAALAQPVDYLHACDGATFPLP